MKYELEIPDGAIPGGWEATGFHKPKKGEWYVDGKDVRMASFDFHTNSCLILRRKEPARESMWVNAYRYCLSSSYESRESVERVADPMTRQGVIRLDYEDNKLVAVTLEPQ